VRFGSVGEVAPVLEYTAIDLVPDLVQFLLQDLAVGWGIFELGALFTFDRLPPKAVVYSKRAVNAWVLSKPVCVRQMLLSAGLRLRGYRFTQLRMMVC
jgi:hypothetical protein